uniref:immunoglobulin superfamily member 8 n=1 Tax=Doryrhamphus excisus TaxID=161450 RepID=UPI0025AE1585|nr:immunoglobulin superfamily member 8 [Doryrhamphus excisus]
MWRSPNREMKSAMALTKTALFVCLHYLLQHATCREVTLPKGPLYRVAGFNLSLPCSVSGYEGPSKQDFEWSLFRDDSGGRKLGVVATNDNSFPYAQFQSRVANGEVRVERDSGDKVRLVVQKLRTEDQGEYECYTPSTDSKYLGSYAGTAVVKVIRDTLQISYSRSLTSQPVPEGAELTLTCSASIGSEQLTHLSVTFGKRGGSSGSMEIISIDKMLGVVPGGAYRKRYDDGEITLEKRNGDGGQGVYVMKMRALQPDDNGAYYCEAAQWIRDPDRTWQKIAHRTLDIGNLTVRPLSESLSVESSPKGEVTLQVGSPMLLSCQLNGMPWDVDSGLLIQWMKTNSAGGVEVEVARMSPNGVVSWGDDLSRASGGSMEKAAQGKYTLKLFSARPSDSGVYSCMASVYTGRRSPAPSAAATLTRRSEGVTVNLKSKDVLVSAWSQLPRGPLLRRGSTITLICNVTVTTTGPAQAQVQWWRRPLPQLLNRKRDAGPTEAPVEVTPTLVAALMYDGVVRVYNGSSEVSVDRLSAVSYRLRVHSASDEDQGMYTCHAEAWSQDPHGGWYNTGTRAESNAVTVYLYARAADLLLIPLVVGVSSALFVGIVIIATVTCCFMKRLSRRARK